jgi:hypothetical protein
MIADCVLWVYRQSKRANRAGTGRAAMDTDIERINAARSDIKALAARVWDHRRAGLRQSPGPEATGEAMANITLAYRHLEDASMRLGKALQALDGGVSVYDKETTVGA